MDDGTRPQQGHSIVQRTDEYIRIFILIHIHPSTERVTERLESSRTHRLSFNLLKKGKNMTDIINVLLRNNYNIIIETQSRKQFFTTEKPS